MFQTFYLNKTNRKAMAPRPQLRARGLTVELVALQAELKFEECGTSRIPPPPGCGRGRTRAVARVGISAGACNLEGAQAPDAINGVVDDYRAEAW